jgi:hypothetical protein
MGIRNLDGASRARLSKLVVSARRLVDSRFRLTRLVENYATGDLMCCLDYMKDGKGCVSNITLDREQMAELSWGQIEQYVEGEVMWANESLKDFVDGVVE